MERVEADTSLGLLHGTADEGAVREARNRRRARLKRLRQALLGLMFVLVALGVTLALLPAPLPVDSAPVTRGALAVEVRETGQTRVKDRYVVSAPVAGALLRVALEANDAVEEGATLAQIAPAPTPLLDARTRSEAGARLAAAMSALEHAEAQLALAKTANEQAESELARAEALGKAASLPQQALDGARFTARLRAGEVASARFARKVAAEQARVARAALKPRSDTAPAVEVSSPVSGNVLRVYRESASVVAAGTPLFELGNLAALEVVVDLLTTDAVQLGAGTKAVIEGWGGQRQIAGQVRKVELAAFTRPSALGVDEQRANVIVVLSDPRERWASLGDGYQVEVRFVLWEGDDVVKVPQGATFRRGDGWAAFRIDDGVARLVPVRVGHRGESEVEIIEGLSPGQRVVIDPGDAVEDGVRVEPRG